MKMTKKMTKKMMCLLGSAMLLVTLAGCGAPEETRVQDGQQASEQQEQESQPSKEQQDQTDQQQEDRPPTDSQGQESQPPSEEGMEESAELQNEEDVALAGESASIRVWGPILRIEDGNLVIDNRADVSFRGEMVITVDPEHTRILDGENGYPVEVSELNEGEAVFAYIGPAATMSEPPIVNASLILCKIPGDLRLPDYLQVTAMEEQPDGSYLLSGNNGIQYLVPMDCEILPFLTRNVVTLQDVQVGSSCLIWSDENRTAQKIVLFAD